MATSGSAIVIGVGPEQGLGAALARCFARNGLHVFISGRSEDKLHQVASGIQQSGGTVTPIAADATVENSVRSLFDQICAHDDIIQVGAGTFTIDTPLNIDYTASIIGESAATTILDIIDEKS